MYFYSNRITQTVCSPNFIMYELFYSDWHGTVVPSGIIWSNFFVTVDLDNKSLILNRYNASIYSRVSETTHVYVLELQPTEKKEKKKSASFF
jgi:hypothetical protein